MPVTPTRIGATGQADDSCADSIDDSSGEFGGEMAMAEMLSSSAAVAQKPQSGSLGGKFQLDGSSKPSAGPSREAGKFEKSAPQSPMVSEDAGALIQKMAVGSNTGAEITGLKPWSKEWVMEGGLNRHPAQKTLLGGDTRGESADASEKLASLAKLIAASSAPSDGSMPAEMATAMGTGISGGMLEGPADGTLEGLQLAGMNPSMVEFSNSPQKGAPARKKAMSGGDFLSIKQEAAPAMVKGQSIHGASDHLKVIPGGLQAPIMGQGRPESPDPVTGGKAKDQGPLAGDTLGLIHPELNGKGGVALSKSTLPFSVAPGTMQLNGAVVPGTMQRNRLSSESVLGVSQGIRELKASGGGEMRLRLKPDHLGELHLKVVSGGKTGSEIGLQIQASDERAKKILEESIGSLKDSLAGQSLSLNKVEVQVSAPSAGSSSSNSFGQESRSDLFGQQFAQGDSKQSGQGNSQQSGERMDGLRSGASTRQANQAFVGGSGGSSRSASAAGRLDVMA